MPRADTTRCLHLQEFSGNQRLAVSRRATGALCSRSDSCTEDEEFRQNESM